MPNPIADPLVENVISEDVADLVRLEATPEGVAVVSIGRPEAANALDGPTVAALHEAFETLHGADHVRIVFLRGEGGTFCSGGDLEWARSATHWDEAANRDDAAAVGHMLKALSAVPALTVALVEGAAIGGGAGLVAACDLAVATRDARFGFPEVRFGLAPAMIAPYVVNAIGPRAAKALFATGQGFDAAYAEKVGLVQTVVQDVGALHAEQERLAGEALQAAPEAVRLAKKLAWDVWGRPIDRDLIDDTARILARRRLSDEGREGIAAALEGRPPRWAS